MRTLTLALLITLVGVGGLLAPARSEEKKTPAKEDPKLAAAWKELEGRWKRVSMSYAEFHVDLTDQGVEFQITQDCVTTYIRGKLVHAEPALTFVIDPTQKPAYLDSILTPKTVRPQTTKGIYRIDGDTLEIVFHSAGYTGERPTSFDVSDITDKKDPHRYVYKRVKEAKEKK